MLRIGCLAVLLIAPIEDTANRAADIYATKFLAQIPCRIGVHKGLVDCPDLVRVLAARRKTLFRLQMEHIVLRVEVTLVARGNFCQLLQIASRGRHAARGDILNGFGDLRPVFLAHSVEVRLVKALLVVSPLLASHDARTASAAAAASYGRPRLFEFVPREGFLTERSPNHFDLGSGLELKLFFPIRLLTARLLPAKCKSRRLLACPDNVLRGRSVGLCALLVTLRTAGPSAAHHPETHSDERILPSRDCVVKTCRSSRRHFREAA